MIIRKLLCALLLGLPGLALADLEITITGGQVQPVSIGIVPFAAEGTPDSATDIARVIEADLTRSGLFAPFPRQDMIELPSAEAQVRYENWRALGVEQLVVGALRQAQGRWVVDFRLLDVPRAQSLLAYEVPVSSAGLRYAGHQISDLIYQKLTGHRGVFNTRIAYVTASGPVDNRVFQLMIADADGYDPRQLVRSTEPLMSPTWSPDGRQMAFVAFENGQSAIFLQTVATGVVRKLTNKSGINGAPAFSPDGRKLAVTLSYEGNPEIYLLDIATETLTRLTRDPAIDTEPAFSPDGRHIVFTSDRAGRAQLYRMSANGGGEPERLSFEGRSNARASFSPDGKTLALVHQDERGFRIATMDVKTRQLQVLSDGPLDESPSFAPNGVAIIYAAKGARGAELATVTTDTGIRQRLSQAGDVREPAWSPFHN